MSQRNKKYKTYTIGSAGDGIPGVQKEGEVRLSTETDLGDAEYYASKYNNWIGSINTAGKFSPKKSALEAIEKVLSEVSPDEELVIYYTGHGTLNKGDWCFSDGTISFQEIETLVNRYKVKVWIVSDSCYSGNWCNFENPNISVIASSRYDYCSLNRCFARAFWRGEIVDKALSCLPQYYIPGKGRGNLTVNQFNELFFCNPGNEAKRTFQKNLPSPEKKQEQQKQQQELQLQKQQEELKLQEQQLQLQQQQQHNETMDKISVTGGAFIGVAGVVGVSAAMTPPVAVPVAVFGSYVLGGIATTIGIVTAPVSVPTAAVVAAGGAAVMAVGGLLGIIVGQASKKKK